MDPKARRLLSAATSPLALAVAAAGAATFVLSGLPWVLPLTFAVGTVVVVTQYRARPEAAPLPAAYLERERAIAAQSRRLAEALEAASEGVRGYLGELPGQLSQLTGKVTRLLERQARLDAFVAELQPGKAQRALAELERSLSSARTAEARERFASALQNKRAELDARDGLRANSERIAAELAEIEAALGSALSKLVAMESLQGEEVREGGAGISSALHGVLAEVTALEQALSETADPQRRRLRG